jgi:hypothetical protein
MQAALIMAKVETDIPDVIVDALDGALQTLAAIHRIMDGDPARPKEPWGSGADMLIEISERLEDIQYHVRDVDEFDGETWHCDICKEELHLSIPMVESQGFVYYLREHLSGHIGRDISPMTDRAVKANFTEDGAIE